MRRFLGVLLFFSTAVMLCGEVFFTLPGGNRSWRGDLPANARPLLQRSAVVNGAEGTLGVWKSANAGSAFSADTPEEAQPFRECKNGGETYVLLLPGAQADLYFRFESAQPFQKNAAQWPFAEVAQPAELMPELTVCFPGSAPGFFSSPDAASGETLACMGSASGDALVHARALRDALCAAGWVVRSPAPETTSLTIYSKRRGTAFSGVWKNADGTLCLMVLMKF